MPNIREIAQKITSVKSAQQITKAMKMVAAAKLNKVQAKATQLYPYKEKLKLILENATNIDLSQASHDLLQEKKAGNTLFIVVGSDKGLCGAYNANILKKFQSYIADYRINHETEKIIIAPIGEKILASLIKNQNQNIIIDYVDALAKLSYENARSIANGLMQDYKSSKYTKILIVFTHFKSVSSGQPVVERFLPINLCDVMKEMSEIKNISKDFIFDSKKEETLNIILPKYALIHFYSLLLESSASEHSSRMVTMNKATDNASTLLGDLSLSYNRIRQATITQEIAEIVSGASST